MSSPARTFRFLLGYISDKEAWDTFRGRAEPPFDSQSEVAAAASRAREAIRGQPNPHLGGGVREVDIAASQVLERVPSHPEFREAIGGLDWAFKLIELDKLVCIQKYVDWNYVEELNRRSPATDPLSLACFSLTDQFLPRDWWMGMDYGGRSFTLSSANSDFRVASASLKDDPTSHRKLLQFGIGWGVPFVTVVQADARLYLRNGTHRACAMRNLGVTHAPVLFLRGKDFSDSGAVGPGFFDRDLLRSQHPPTIRDFFDGQVSPPIRLLPMTKVIRIESREFGTLSTGLAPLPVHDQAPSTAGGIEERGAVHYLSFTTVREEWGSYRLADGSTLRMRLLLSNAREIAGPTPGQYQITAETANPIIAVLVPENLRGVPAMRQYSQDELTQAVDVPTMEVAREHEATSEYSCSNGARILLRVGSLNVARTRLFGPTGDAMYLVTAETAIQIVPPARAVPEG